MYVRAHELFKRFMSGMDAKPAASVVHSLSEPPMLGDFLNELDPELSLDWSSQSFQGLPSLREKVISRTGTNVECNIANVLITAGTAEANFLTISQLLQPEDEMIVDVPGWPQPLVLGEAIGANIKRLHRKEDKAWRFDIDELSELITERTKLIFLCNPNNPTGTYLTKKEIIELRKKLNKRILLVIDDAYAEYMKNEDYKSGLELFKNMDNVFILRTFSKIFGLASLRVGWGYGSKKIINALNIIKPPFNVSHIAQLAATEALKDKKFIDQSIKHNFLFAKKIKTYLEQYQIFSNSTSANFLLLDFKNCKHTAKYLYEKLKQRGIIVRSTEDGYHIRNKLRLTIGSKQENLAFMNAVKNILN